MTDGNAAKQCTKCGEIKLLTMFSLNKRLKSGRDAKCKACANACTRAWRAAHPGSGKEYGAAWRSANAERMQSLRENWLLNNSAKEKATRAIYRKNNREKLRLAAVAYGAANKDRRKAASDAWAKANPEKRRLGNHRRRVRAISGGGRLSVGLSAKLLSLQKGRCASCHLLLGTDYELDHIHPLALGGSNEDKNIQLLHSTCNRKKGAKHPADFMRQQGFLL